jgi:large subunit ribosomal protein L29
MKAKDLRQETDEELRIRIAENRKMLTEFSFNNAITPVEQSHKIRVARKDIARMHTILRERELNATRNA